MKALGLRFSSELHDGSMVHQEQEIARVTGNPLQVATAEERIIGTLSKTSGVATAAHHALEKVSGRCEVVSGGWKKMPYEIKETLRQAVVDGGIRARISEKPFVYLDKNHVRIFGGVCDAVRAAVPVNRVIVVQIRGETHAVEDEAVEAVEEGANIVMVDTGRREHLHAVIHALKAKGLRPRVRIAFAGGVTLDDLDALAHIDIDIIDIGYAILDAPCLPMRFDVLEVSK
jgi:nicotinate-nucleotide pyrophosphorylase (carboxylating)